MDTAGRIGVALAGAAAFVYGIVLVSAAVSNRVGSNAIAVGIGLVLIVQAAQSLHAITAE